MRVTTPAAPKLCQSDPERPARSVDLGWIDRRVDLGQAAVSSSARSAGRRRNFAIDGDRLAAIGACKTPSPQRWHLDPPVPTATILLTHVQNAVPAFDHGAWLANKAVALLIVSPAAVAGPVTTPDPTGRAERVRADRTPRAVRVAPTQAVTLDEEEMADVRLATFHLFDKENNGSALQQMAWGCRCGGCRACAWRGCGCGGCAGCGGCCQSWGRCRWC